MHPTHTRPDVADPTPADILRCAALYLDRHGWHRGDMFTDPEQPTPAACVQGAIRMAACGSATSPYTVDTARHIDRASRILAGHLHDSGHVDTGDYYGALAASDTEILGDWNDETGRTAADIILALHEAADTWDSRHPARHPGGAR